MNTKRILLLKGGAIGSLGALVSVLPIQFGITTAVAAPLSETAASSHTKAHAVKKHAVKKHVTKKHAVKKHVTKANAVKKKVTKRKASVASSSGSFLGTMTQTQFGPIEVKVTVSNGRITQVSAPVYPNTLYQDKLINSQAIPMLEQEVMKVQSSNIQGVGGASFTSQGFYGSLVSALAKAHLK
ncbi:MAG TPA: FMN-binding protein [archaeon]|nr:FMN-binding protein [archaeon]